MAITRADVGAWLVKGDPDKKWDYWQAMADAGVTPGNVEDGNWSLGKTYRNFLIERNDLIVLYMGGQTAEIVEIGIVTSDALHTDDWNKPYVIDPKELGKRRLFFDYRSVVLRRSVRRADMKNDPILAGAEVIRASQIQNPSFLTPAQVRALLPHFDPADLKAGGWTTAALKRANVR